MLRRRLLQGLAAVPAVAMIPVALNPVLKSDDAVGAHIPKGHYIVLIDIRTIEIDGLAQMEAPEGVTMDLIPVRLMHGQSIHDVMAIYKIAPDESLPTPDKGIDLIQVVPDPDNSPVTGDEFPNGRTILGLKT